MPEHFVEVHSASIVERDSVLDSTGAKALLLVAISLPLIGMLLAFGAFRNFWDGGIFYVLFVAAALYLFTSGLFVQLRVTVTDDAIEVRTHPRYLVGKTWHTGGQRLPLEIPLADVTTCETVDRLEADFDEYPTRIGGGSDEHGFFLELRTGDTYFLLVDRPRELAYAIRRYAGAPDNPLVDESAT
jgi:hypothetical protein